MEKKELIKIENAAIRAAGSRMSQMFQPRIPMGPGEHEGYKEARRSFYEGFQEGAAYYRLLMSRISDEFASLIEGARLDSGNEEDTHSVMEMCMKNGIPVITAVQMAPGKKEAEKCTRMSRITSRQPHPPLTRKLPRSLPRIIPRKLNPRNRVRTIPPCP